MRLLSLIDQLFLLLEKDRQPMHVGGLFIFDIPAYDGLSAKDFVKDLVNQIMLQKSHPVYPFNQVLYKQIFWKPIAQFNIHQHFHHITLTQPFSHRTLLDYISVIHQHKLDRAYPLWQCYLIEGAKTYEDNDGGNNNDEGNNKHRTTLVNEPKQFALYVKIHHSLLDGTAAMKILQQSLSPSANDHISLPPWSMLSRGNKPDSNSVTDNIAQVFKQGVKAQLKATLPNYKNLIKRATHKQPSNQRNHPNQSNQHTNHSMMVYDVPKTIFNQRISANRKIITCSFSIKRIKAIADRCEVSLNDILLTLCSGALRRYLQPLNALPDKPLIAMIPTSMRGGSPHTSSSHKNDSFKNKSFKNSHFKQDPSLNPHDKHLKNNYGKIKKTGIINKNTHGDRQADTDFGYEMGNQLAFILCDLGTHLPFVRQRLDCVHQSMSAGKKAIAKMTQAEFINYAAVNYGLDGLNLLTEFNPKKQPFNLVISNVIGANDPLYWNGAQLKHVYPASVLLSGLGLNITITSYASNLEFGIVVCPEILPEIDTILTALDKEIACLEQLELDTFNTRFSAY